MTKILIVGATSAIAHETAKLFANNKAKLFLAGRSQEKLNAVCNDLLVRGAEQAETFCLDLTKFDQHQQLLDTAINTLGGLDAVLIAHGTLGDQQACEQSVTKTISEFNVNCLSVISILTIVANYFEEQMRGCIAVITSVAGDRGRKSNYIYGTAKGALNVFLQGLRNRLFSSGVSVVTIKPGFVDTPMTASIPKNSFFTQPQTVAKGIYRAMKQGKNVVYLPWFWRPIMLIVKIIPESIFKKMNL